MMHLSLYRLTLTTLATMASASLAGPLGAQQPPRATQPLLVVGAENPSALPRQDETVAVPWSAVVQRLESARPERVRVLDVRDREVTSQVVDNDGDGRPDELLFLADFWPQERRVFRIEAIAPRLTPTPRVHVRHDQPRDDIAWESDRIAFRIYGEGLKRTPSAMSSSGIDVWPKRVRALVVEKWYAKGHDAYHVDTGEGADFFDVGETLGAGGTAVWRGDTIYRADNFKSYRVLANGPIRAIVELRYDPWNAGGLSISETKRITIDAGQNLYRQENVFRAAGVAEVLYVIGVVKRSGMVATMSKAQPWAWLTGWGPVAPKNGGHGELGTAVLLPRERVVDWKEGHNHYLAVSRATPGQPVVHYVGAGWTASGDFPTPQAWWAYLDRFAQRLAAPIKVSLSVAEP